MSWIKPGAFCWLRKDESIMRTVVETVFWEVKQVTLLDEG